MDETCRKRWMIYLKKIDSQFEELGKVRTLYETAFPENERGPLEILLDDPSGCSELFALYDAAVFCGFLSLLTYRDLSHILYLAVDPGLRKNGYGSIMLRELGCRKLNNRILADIEADDPGAANNDQRGKRRKFYLNNGYAPSDVRYTWQGESYEILVQGGQLTKTEFWDFWDAVCKQNIGFQNF